MRLLVAHKILISAAIVLAVVLLFRGIRIYTQNGSSTDLGMGLASGTVGVVLTLYLRSIWPK